MPVIESAEIEKSIAALPSDWIGIAWLKEGASVVPFSSTFCSSR